MIAFMVMCRKADGGWEGMGEREFAAVPQVGHFVTADDGDGVGQAYEVVAVIHPLNPATSAGDMILKYVSTDIELRQRLGRL